MMQQIVFKKTVGPTNSDPVYTIKRLMNLPKWDILLGTPLSEDQYDKQLEMAQEEGVDVILE